MRKREIGAFIGGLAGNAVFYFAGYVIMIIPIWLAWIGFGISMGILIYSVYLLSSPISKTPVSPDNNTEVKQKTLKRVFAHVEHDKKGIYIVIENKDFFTDVTCSEIIVYEVNQIKESLTFFDLDMQKMQNSFGALGATILPLLPTTKIDDTLTFVRHRSKETIDFLAIRSSKNQLEFRTLYERKPLARGSYNIVFGFTVYPQKDGYENFDIYITIQINYRGKSNLELCELRNARTKEPIFSA